MLDNDLATEDGCQLIAALLLQPGLHVLDAVVVLGVDHDQTTMLGALLHHLEGGAIVDADSVLAGRDIGGKELDGWCSLGNRVRDRRDRLLRGIAEQDRMKGEVDVPTSEVHRERRRCPGALLGSDPRTLVDEPEASGSELDVLRRAPSLPRSSLDQLE